MTKMKRTVIVTGGAGYIGSHTCKALSKSGFLPVVYDNLSTGHKEFVKWGPLLIGDIIDTEKFESAIRNYEPIAVLHFAASAYVGESIYDPSKYYRNNVAGSAALIEVVRRCGIGRIVFSSTCATYGNPEVLPITEDFPQHPINPYGRSKLMVEQMLADADSAYGIKSICLRYFNAAGADAEGELWEWHDPETHLIPRILMASSGITQHLTIFGDDYETEDGTCVRDYIHVEDLADAHVAALNFLIDKNLSNSFNLGTGIGVSNKQMIQAAQRITGSEIQTIIAPRRPGDPAVLSADSEKASKLLSWFPRKSTIENILSTAWQSNAHVRGQQR